MVAVTVTALSGLALVAARSTEAPGIGTHEAEAVSQSKAGVDGPAPTATPVPIATTESRALVASPSSAVFPAPVGASAVKSAAPAQTAPKRAARPAPPSNGDCDPPFTTDADGTRRYKLKCL
jgi:hypothetical protein